MDISRRDMVAALTLGVGSPAGSAVAADMAAAPAAGAGAGAGAGDMEDIRRYGVVPNDAGAAHANTAALRQLCSPEISPAGFAGGLKFPNTTGADIYHFDDIITFRDGIRLELQNCTLSFTKNGADPHAQNAGFIYAVRNFSIQNGAIEVHYASAGPGQGNAMCLGSRSAPGIKYFPNHFDALLPAPQGNILIRNLRISSDNPNAKLVVATGGLRNVSFVDVVLNGNGVCDGIYYEFGWHTNESNPAMRQTSHAHNLRFVNIVANNLKRTSDGAAIGANGAYNVMLDGISVNGSYNALSFGTGESLYYRPAVGLDDAGAKRNIRIRNLVAQNLTGTGVEITGANVAAGYLRTLGLGARAMADLLDCTVEGFVVESAAGYGIRSSAGRLVVADGRISKCQRGIVTTDECTWFAISDVAVLDSTSIGLQISQEVSIIKPPREKMGVIRNCFIAGNGTAAPGTNPGILLTRCRSVLIENNRFGYEPGHDGRSETTQAAAVVVSGAETFGVRCVGNFVAGTAGDAPAYSLWTAGTNGRGCTIEHAGGIVSQAGLWGDGLHQLDRLAFNSSMTPDCQFSDAFLITASDPRAFTIAAPQHPAYGRRVLITIINATGGTLGTCTWQPAFKLGPWENPRSGHGRSIEFMYDGARWLEIARTAQEVPA
jgi:hypothetical protein